MAGFRKIVRTARAANGQVRIWVEVADGELLMIKVPEASTDTQVREVVRSILTARQADADARAAEARRAGPVAALTLADAAAEVARIDAEVLALQARKAEIAARVR